MNVAPLFNEKGGQLFADIMRLAGSLELCEQ